MTTKFQGSKYVRGMNVTEIAKRIRADIKAAVASGALPKAKYSVRIERYSMGQSVTVKVSDVVIPNATCLRIYTEEFLRASVETPHTFFPHDRMTTSACSFLRAVKAIVNEYNEGESDSHTDYYRSNFHSSVSFDWRWEKSVRDAQLARLYPVDAA